MRNLLLPILFILININQIFSQTNLFPASGSAGIGTVTPNSSALLDLTSTSQGILVPRMTLAQRTAIVTPATGLLIYQTNSTPGFYYYTGSVWTPISVVDANRNLSNLLATSINQDLVPAVTNSRSLGNVSKRWKDIHLYNLRFADGSTQNTAAKVYTAGVGISIGGTVITNTTPDQIVLLNGSGATTISGTYPNFTISSTDNNTTYSAGVGLNLLGTTFENTAPDQIITLTGGGSTSITGTYPNFTITTPTGGSGWLLSGNSGTVDGTNFIGTTDNTPFNIKVNNEKAGRIDPILSNTFLGYQSGNSNTSGNNNTANGFRSLYSNADGIANTANGANSLFSNTIGGGNTATGVSALYYNTMGYQNSATGYGALFFNTLGFNNAAFGNSALNNNITGSKNTAIGHSADVLSGDLTNATAIGFNAKVATSYSLVLGGTGADAVNVGIGTTSPSAKLEVIGSVKITDGTQGSGKILTSDANGLSSWQNPINGWTLTGNSGTIAGTNFIGTNDNVPIYFRVNNEKSGEVNNILYNTFLGYQSGNSNTSGTWNSAYGMHALFSNINGSGNLATGGRALYFNTSGNFNTASGHEALYSNTVGNNNTAIGFDAMIFNTIGNNNVANGMQSLNNNNTGSNNTANGYQSLFNNTTGNNNMSDGYGALYSNTSGNHNTAAGMNSLSSNTTGEFNTAVGFGANVTSGALTNATAIGANSNVSASNSLVLGNNVNVGIGTTAPTAKLEVIGNVKITDGSQGSGKILTSDASGLATWTSNNNWTLSGNAGTIDGTNFIGTTDNIPLNFKVNNQKAGRIDNTYGNAFFGYQSGNSNTTGGVNSAIGHQALYSNTEGFWNTANGSYALYSNTTGQFNTATGGEALYFNTTGIKNTANGFESLLFNTTGYENTANGYGSLRSNTTGSYNTANGMESLLNNTSGSQNTASGTNALHSNTTGIGNTANGMYALTTNTSGEHNTALGHGADVTSGALTNATAIGYNAKVASSNSLVLGGTGADAVNVGIGTTTPTYKLEVTEDALINAVRVGRGNGNISSNTATGNQTLNSNTTGYENTANGYGSLRSNTTGSYNTANGMESLLNNTSGSQNTASGTNALHSNTTGIGNTANGMYALTTNTSGEHNTALGHGADVTSGALTNATAIGYNAKVGASNSIVLGGTGLDAVNVGIGTTSPSSKLEVNGAVKIIDGTQGNGKILTSDANGLASWQMPLNAWTITGNSGTIAGTNFIGTTDNVPLTFKVNNQNAGRIDNDSQNTFFGYQSGNSNTGYSNTAIGYLSLFSNTGSLNSANGIWSLYTNTTGSQNTASGMSSLYSNTTGNLNTACGTSSLYTNTTGNHNTALGYNADVTSGALTNATAIGYNAKVAASNSLVLGGTGAEAVNVGIGTTSPSAKLEVIGNVKITDGSQGSGKVLTSDASGFGSWQIPSGSGWSLTGNSGTIDGTNFIGTTDNIPLTFKVNNQKAGRIDNTNANTFFGYLSGNSNTTGSSNTANGNQSLLVNTTGNANTAFGFDVLYSNTSGAQNTAIGVDAMFSNITGTQNTALGYESLRYNTIGTENTAIGDFAIYNNITGYHNSSLGGQSLYLNDSGRFNTANGFRALYSNTSGNYNTALGYLTDVSAGSLNNATAIGYNSMVDASDKVRIGNSSVTSNGGQVGWSTYSDARIKENVQENVPGINFINQLRPVTYHYDVTKQNQIEGIADTMQWESKYDIEKIQFTGFIAQEVDAAAKKINYDFSGVDKSGTLMALRYSEFVVPLVKAAQELDSVNTLQDVQVSDLQSTVLNQQSEIDALKTQIATLTSAMNTTNFNDGAIAIGISENDNAMLGQNIPNPFDNSTLIPFRIPKNCKDASIMITNVGAGKVITVVPISCEETHISFEAGELASGTYTYSLIVDGIVIGTKQMIISK